jgi:hypothetical protein
MSKNSDLIISIVIISVVAIVILAITPTILTNSVFNPERPFVFNNITQPLPEQKNRTFNEMNYYYPISGYLYDLRYLNLLGNSYNTKWTMLSTQSFAPLTSTTFKQYYYTPKPNQYIVAVARPDSTNIHRLTVEDYYGNTYNTGFASNNLTIIIEVDSEGISVFKRGNAYEDRLNMEIDL